MTPPAAPPVAAPEVAVTGMLADRGGLDLWADVAGQPRAVDLLRASAAHPVHAYLLVGPRGCGKRALARAFGAELLGASLEGADALRLSEQVAREQFPDYTVVQRTGASILTEQALEAVKGASRSAVEGDRKVIVLDEFHLVTPEVAARLLKTIEEPPTGVFFLVLADKITEDLVTIASRCVQVDLGPVPTEVIVERLVHEGVPRTTAEDAAGGAAGDLARARVLATDPQLAFRRQLWFDVPTKLDGTGYQVVRQVDEIIAALDNAVAPLEARQASEVEELEARVAEYGERGSGRKELEARHKREVRRFRTDELRFGFAVLARRYRDAAAVSDRPAPLLAAIDAIAFTNEGFIRSPNEKLQLQALFLKLPPLR